MLITMCHIGAISDSSTSSYRRRYWIWAATCALSVATITLAYVEPIASFFVTLFSNIEDWNPDRKRLVRRARDLWGFHSPLHRCQIRRSEYPFYVSTCLT